jgi:hypothetical protein
MKSRFTHFLLLLLAVSPSLQAGPVVRLLYNNITGSDIGSLRLAPTFPSQPTDAQVLTNGLEVGNVAPARDNFGSYTRGYIQAPLTGEFTFWRAANDSAHLWMGTNYTISNPDPSELTLVSRCEAAVPTRAWTARREQTSGKIYMLKGRYYYFEILHKDSGGDDYLALCWQWPD